MFCDPTEEFCDVPCLLSGVGRCPFRTDDVATKFRPGRNAYDKRDVREL